MSTSRYLSTFSLSFGFTLCSTWTDKCTLSQYSCLQLLGVEIWNVLDFIYFSFVCRVCSIHLPLVCMVKLQSHFSADHFPYPVMSILYFYRRIWLKSHIIICCFVIYFRGFYIVCFHIVVSCRYYVDFSAIIVVCLMGCLYSFFSVFYVLVVLLRFLFILLLVFVQLLDIVFPSSVILQRWNEYFGELFSDEKERNLQYTKMEGDAMIKSEIKYAIDDKKKAGEPDSFVIEMISALNNKTTEINGIWH